jgi:hypothetical protein
LRHDASKIVSVKSHKADDTATETATAPLETPTSNPVGAEEDAPHKREETMEISLAKSGCSAQAIYLYSDKSTGRV